MIVYCCGRWFAISQALSRLAHPFAAGFTAAAAPLAAAASVALMIYLARLRWAAALAAFWALATFGAQWHLKKSWGYGPRDLASAAGLPAGRAPEAAVLKLIPGKGAEEVSAGELSPERLEKMQSYLEAHRYRSVFGREAVDAIRRGWLLWWDANRALAAQKLGAPELAADYRQALALLRAGPVTAERFDKLKDLAALALKSSKGFEDVTQSQYIFEAFSSAFGHFGDAENARFWLYKIDGLWPIYDKKVEVSAVEYLLAGEILGSLLIDGKPAPDIKVGLFSLSLSTQTYKNGANLCCSQYPDSAGRFQFSNMGRGKYYLALQGNPALLKGRIANNPGVIELSDRHPVKELSPILIERTGSD